MGKYIVSSQAYGDRKSELLSVFAVLQPLARVPVSAVFGPKMSLCCCCAHIVCGHACMCMRVCVRMYWYCLQLVLPPWPFYRKHSIKWASPIQDGDRRSSSKKGR